MNQGRRLPGVAVVVVGAVGFAACLRSAFTAMRDVLVTDGGYCASGGPYVSAHQCSGADLRLLLVGILGGLAAAAVLAGGTSMLGRSGIPSGLLAWTALFGVLGWNFLSLGLHPAARHSGSAGWLISGAVFWLLAAGGLVPALGQVAAEFRNAGRTDPVLAAAQPLVRAIQLPGLMVPQAGRVAGPPADASGFAGGNGRYPGGAGPTGQSGRRAGLASAGLWLAAAVVGAAGGIAAGGSLVSLLR